MNVHPIIDFFSTLLLLKTPPVFSKSAALCISAVWYWVKSKHFLMLFAKQLVIKSNFIAGLSPKNKIYIHLLDPSLLHRLISAALNLYGR